MSGGEPASRLYFIGVTTRESSIRSVFPLWAAALGLNAEIVGRDLPLRGAQREYRRCVHELREDGRAVGALVTSHKAAVYDSARDLFASLDGYASLCREVSCISCCDGELHGYAKDPITAGMALGEIFTEGKSVAGRDVVCFGAGGAGMAITVSLLQRPDSPRRVVLVDRDEQRITVAREILDSVGHALGVDYRLSTGPGDNDELLRQCSSGALVINATGMGKDLPGAPITPRAVFPSTSVVWDLNYRGELSFLALASKQARERGLLVADGWQYFLHGWAEVIAQIFEISMTPERFRRLADIAGRLRAEARSSDREPAA